jgi:hypothetical protein
MALEVTQESGMENAISAFDVDGAATAQQEEK